MHLTGRPSLVAMALGSSMHCWYAFMICVPVLLVNAILFFQHSICNLRSLSMSDTFFCLLFLSVNVNRRFRRLGGFTLSLGLCRVEEHQHQLAHQCSPNIIGIWEWGICGLMGGAFMT